MEKPRYALVLAVFAVTGCNESPWEAHDSLDRSTVQVSESIELAEAQIRARLSGPLNHDELFAAAAGIEPSFAGLYYESDVLHIVTVDPDWGAAGASALAAAVLRVAGRPELASRAHVARMVHARYSFVELAAWLNVLRPVLHQFDIHGVVISEVENVILIDSDAPERASGLVDWAREAGIPTDAVRVRYRGRATYTHHVGGHGVDVERDGFIGPPAPCTLAQVVQHFDASLMPDTALYGVTNSHCTGGFGVNLFDRFVHNGAPIADAVWDHPLITDARCVALTGQSTEMCRYSDAALFRYRSSFTSQLQPHRILTPATDSLHSEDLAFTGEIVNKHGRATGLTWGVVTDTCYDKLMPAQQPIPSIGLLCHYQAAYASDFGDSGAPVWLRDDTYPQGTRRFFAGIHTSKDEGGSIFSSVGYLMQEIVPPGSNWGSICFSFPQADPGSWTCAW